jgi:hypothetical protein
MTQTFIILTVLVGIVLFLIYYYFYDLHEGREASRRYEEEISRAYYRPPTPLTPPLVPAPEPKLPEPLPTKEEFMHRVFDGLVVPELYVEPFQQAAEATYTFYNVARSTTKEKVNAAADLERKLFHLSFAIILFLIHPFHFHLFSISTLRLMALYPSHFPLPYRSMNAAPVRGYAAPLILARRTLCMALRLPT